MATKTDTTTGTLTLTSGSVDFTTVGTNMITRGHLPGDEIYVAATGAWLIIETITGENTGTLRYPCPAACAGVGLPVTIRFQPDGSRVKAEARNLIDSLGNGILPAIAELDWTDGQQLIALDGIGSATLINRTDLVSGVDYQVQVDTLADRDDYDNEAAGFAVLVSDIGDGRAALYSKNSVTSGDWSAPAYITAKPRVDIVIDDPGRPAASEVLLTLIVPVAVLFQANMSGSFVEVGNNPTSDAVYSFTKNGVEFATLTISSLGVGTFAGASTSFDPGDIFRAIAPDPRDATLSAVSMTLSATR